MREELRSALVAAMKARDLVAVSALRSALGAIDNAGAVDAAAAPAGGVSEHVAGGVAGLRATEVTRRELTAAEARELVRAEVAERLAVAERHEAAGRAEPAARLRAEAAALQPFLT
ncbi:MAG TPA: hypothetical protein VGD67_04490 [Pseudonocardiaceae bacterium]